MLVLIIYINKTCIYYEYFIIMSNLLKNIQNLFYEEKSTFNFGHFFLFLFCL